MPSLKSIKDRIKGVNSTKKITQAMKIVSSASLKNAERSLFNSTQYLEEIKNTLINIYYKDKESFENSLQKYFYPHSKGKLFVIFSSDRGLCGSFNLKVINKLIPELDDDSQVICIGNKVSQYMKSYYGDRVKRCSSFFQNHNKKISIDQSASLVDEIFDIFVSGNFSECKAIYTKFHSVMNLETKLLDILPLNIKHILRNKSDFPNQSFELDNDAQLILDILIKKYFNALIYNAYCHNLTSEHSARMIAMDNATQNSKKIIKELNLTYNRSRQAIITKELIEIISGAEATQ